VFPEVAEYAATPDPHPPIPEVLYAVGLLVSDEARRFTVTPDVPAVTVLEIPLAPAPREVDPAFAATPTNAIVLDVTAVIW
jgi:hypothetical protein